MHLGLSRSGKALGFGRLNRSAESIPMLGKKTSLNVATAAGIVLYELLRKYCVLSMKAR